MNNSRKYALARAGTMAIAAVICAHSGAAFADEQRSAPSNPATATGTSPGDKGVWSLSTGVSYSRGDYGDIAETEVISVPVSLKYRRGNWRFKVTVPWVHISGPGSLLQTPEGRDSGSGGNTFTADQQFSGSGSSTSGSGSSGSGSSGTSGSGSSGSGSSGSGSSGSGSSGSGSSGGSGGSDSVGGSGSSGIVGGVIVPSTGLVDNRRSGLGDTSASLTYSQDLGNHFYADVSGKLKLPTASTSKRLGTGKVDVTTSLDLGKDVGPASFYISGRRKFAGKPAGSAIRSVWGAGGGASVRASRGLTFGADYDWQQSAFAGGQSSSEVTGWAYMRLAPKIGLTLYAGTGLNQASANILGGATVTVRF